MYRVIFFTAIPMGDDGEQNYGDSGFYLDLDFRPQVGDLFPIHILDVPSEAPPRTNEDGEAVADGDEIDGLNDTGTMEIEQVLYAGNNVFHAYGYIVLADESATHNLGTRDNTGSLIYHYAEQTNTFADRYKRNPGSDRSTLWTDN